MAGVIAVLEQRDGALKRVSYEALTAARSLADALGGEAHALVIGPSGIGTGDVGTYGADKVLVAADDGLKLYQADHYAQIAAAQVGAGDYAAAILPATALGKDLAPRVAAKLGCPAAGSGAPPAGTP